MSQRSELPAPVPHIDADSQAFWDATLEERLLIGHCTACDADFWYPRPICPRCGRWTTTLVQARGTGSVETYTLVHRGPDDYAGVGPYYLAYVRLTEGPVMLTNIVLSDPTEVRIGAPVEVIFDRTDGPAALPRFRLSVGSQVK